MCEDEFEGIEEQIHLEMQAEEIEKCKESPYYYCKTYFKFPEGKRFTTTLSEDDFNGLFDYMFGEFTT